MTNHHFQTRSVLTAAGMTALLALTGCTDAATPRLESGTTTASSSIPVQKLMLPAGLTDPAVLLARLNATASTVQVTAVESSDGKGVFTFYANGDVSTVGEWDPVSTFFIDGVEYVQLPPVDGGEPLWFFADPDESTGRFGLGDLFALDAGQDGALSLKETENGYELALEKAGGASVDMVALTLDQDRALVAFEYFEVQDGEVLETPKLTATVTYPADMPLLSAPSDPKPYEELDGFLAQASVRAAATTAAELLASTPVPELTARMFADAFSKTHSYSFVDVQTAFDANSVGFSNDSRQLELVSSNGTDTCYRVTVSASGDVGEVTSDANGARSDMGFVCSTQITHTGDSLYD